MAFRTCSDRQFVTRKQQPRNKHQQQQQQQQQAAAAAAAAAASCKAATPASSSRHPQKQPANQQARSNHTGKPAAAKQQAEARSNSSSKAATEQQPEASSSRGQQQLADQQAISSNRGKDPHSFRSSSHVHGLMETIKYFSRCGRAQPRSSANISTTNVFCATFFLLLLAPFTNGKPQHAQTHTSGSNTPFLHNLANLPLQTIERGAGRANLNISIHTRTYFLLEQHASVGRCHRETFVSLQRNTWVRWHLALKCSALILLGFDGRAPVCWAG